MATALGVLFMFAASVLPTGRLAFLFLASVVIWIPLNERGGFITAFLCYLATAGVTFLLVSNKMYAGAYLIFFGLYGFMKLGVDMLIPDRIIAFVVKLILMNGLVALALWLATLILQQNVFSLIPEYPLYIAIPVLELAFIAYELLYSFVIKVFDDKLRDVLIPRR
jgi:hypothetical protein